MWLHLQLHRPDDGDPSGRRPVRLQLARRGPIGGAIAGFATLIEFVFAPPAIALAIGAYLDVPFPALDPKLAALGAYFVFMGLNIVGVQIAATFELFVTLYRAPLFPIAPALALGMAFVALSTMVYYNLQNRRDLRHCYRSRRRDRRRDRATAQPSDVRAARGLTSRALPTHRRS